MPPPPPSSSVSGTEPSGGPRPVRLGLLGCGTVGGSLVRLIAERGEDIAARTGVRLEVTRVAVRDPARDRDLPLEPSVLTDDAASVVTADDVDLVVEVVGGTDPALGLITAALQAGRPVVSANKELLAAHGAELFELADRCGVDLLFEAAVAGGIPLVRPLRESLVGEDVLRVIGIINGTTNYILTKMTE
ncbi:MAG: homoserine dehydrogenase, partial [Acidobacteria bacterium]|nr:homoserine dehydrogenase [Acidobacteriota bacterium]